MNAKMKKVVLIGINERNVNCLPLYFLKLYSCNSNIIKKNFEFILFDIHKQSLDQEKLVSEIVSLRPEIVGFSMYLWNADEVMSMAKSIKKALPKTLMLLGGPEVHEKHDFYFTDHLFIGEGEVVFLEFLLDHLKKKKQPKMIYAGAKRVKYLDEIPSPILDGSIKDFLTTSFNLEISRGCPFNCAYCCENKSRTEMAHHSVKRIIKEISYLKEKGIKEIFFLCPVFNYDKKFASVLCQRISKLNKDKQLVFYGDVKAEFLDKPLVDLMAAANFSAVQIGVQTSNSAALKNSNRYQNNALLKENVELLRSRGIDVVCDLIMGLPGDNHNSFKKSLQFGISLKPIELNAFVLKVLPNSGLRKEAKKFQIKFNDNVPYELISNYSFSREDMEKSKRLVSKLRKYAKQRNESPAK